MVIESSKITKCGYQPTDALSVFFAKGCGERLKPKPGDCCVSCSYGSPRPCIQRYTKTGIFVCVRTLFVTLPSTTADSPPRPCDVMAIRSQPLSEAAAIMA